MDFTAINGKIDLTFKSDFDANLEASTVHGSIDIDDQLGVAVEKQLVGQHARGQIGTGGPSLRITTVNGSIKLSKQQRSQGVQRMAIEGLQYFDQAGTELVH